MEKIKIFKLKIMNYNHIRINLTNVKIIQIIQKMKSNKKVLLRYQRII